MKIVKLTNLNYSRILATAERILLSGGIVIAPSDTVYGILGDATKPEVIKKIFKIKQRPGEKAFPIFVRDIATARKLAYVSDAKTKFLEKVWPGAVTVVFHHKEKLPKVLTGGKDTIGIRIPDSKFLLELLSRLDFPLVQTSANISGRPPAKNVKEAKAYFGKQKIRPDLVIDGGEIEGGASTVIDFTAKAPLILRAGPVSRSWLDTLLSDMQ